MNPYALLIAGLLWAGSMGAVTWWAWHAGSDHEIARLAREDDIEQRASAAAADAAASAIAAIKVKQVTIRQETQREIQTNTVYRDCHATPGVVRDINASLTGIAEPPVAPVVVPAASAADR